MLGLEKISAEELRERIVYSLFRPVARIAAQSGIPLKVLTKLLRTAYFHEYRRRGLTLAEICEALEISIATAARLSKDLKVNFFRPELEHELPTRIEYMLWAEAMSSSRIQQVLPEIDNEEIDKAIETLLESGRIVELKEHPGQYQIATQRGRRVGDNWYSRVGALNSLLDNLGTTVEKRFFEEDSNAFSRTLSFRIRADQVGELQKFYEEKLWKTMAEHDETARESDDYKHAKLSIFWVVEDES